MIAMPPMPRSKRERHKATGPQAMPAMPPMPKEGGSSDDLDRNVKWQPWDGIWQVNHTDVEGTCARCHHRVPAIELRWRPNPKQPDKGSWECRECYPRAGKFDIAKPLTTNGHQKTPMGGEPDTIQTKKLIWSKSLQRWIKKRDAVILEV